jgi:hypothetical protein
MALGRDQLDQVSVPRYPNIFSAESPNSATLGEYLTK